jgi:hypothetical protein
VIVELGMWSPAAQPPPDAVESPDPQLLPALGLVMAMGLRWWGYPTAARHPQSNPLITPLHHLGRELHVDMLTQPHHLDLDSPFRRVGEGLLDLVEKADGLAVDGDDLIAGLEMLLGGW